MITLLPNRGVLAVSGDDRVAFLQGLVTNDVTQVTGSRAVYSCLLSPQGRFLHDFFVAADGSRLLLDCEADRRDDLLKRLKMFRLRSRVEIVDETSLFAVSAIHAPAAEAVPKEGIVFADPRNTAMGARMLSLLQATASQAGAVADDPSYVAWDRLRILLGLPDGSRDMEPGEALPMENNIDLANGIAWSKGCYVGQELTARMKYKAVPKRRLTPVKLDGAPVETGTTIFEGDREIGQMRSTQGDIGLALLRADAGAEVSRARDTQVTRL